MAKILLFKRRLRASLENIWSDAYTPGLLLRPPAARTHVIVSDGIVAGDCFYFIGREKSVLKRRSLIVTQRKKSIL